MAPAAIYLVVGIAVAVSAFNARKVAMSNKRRSRGRGRQPATLLGTNLWRDPRTGIYYWRRTDPATGKRRRRTTKTRSFERALRIASRMEEELERERVGLQNLSAWSKELAPLAEEFLEHQAREGLIQPRSLKAKRSRLERALRVLRLETTAALNQVTRIHDQLMKLELKGVKRVTLRRAYQDPLRQFSAWLAGNQRHLEQDPLACWEPISVGTRPSPRRAFLPAEVARALLAAERIEKINHRKHSLVPVFKTLLIAAPRVGALISRDVEHFAFENLRIDFGEDVGKKRRGAGILDPVTARELKGMLESRTEGPLFLSPRGFRLRLERLLDWWRESFGLGLIHEIKPEIANCPEIVDYLVLQTLLRGRPKANRGGAKVSSARKEKLDEIESQALRISGELEVEWKKRMEGVDVHAFRKTHRTWAQAKGVPEVLIDKQLGHAATNSAQSIEVLRVVAGSATGRRHYLDMRSQLLQAERSAQAVRELLDEALAGLSTPVGRNPDHMADQALG